jgi:hypothetical protein
MIQSSSMTATELVRVNGFLPHVMHERAAAALDRDEVLSAELNNILTNLHDLSGATKPDLVAGLNRAFKDIQRLVDELQEA